MQRIKQVISETKQYLVGSYKTYKTQQVLKHYDKQQYDKIIEFCQSWTSYRTFEINDHKLIFFLISEQKNDLIDSILSSTKCKTQIINDDENRNAFFPLTFAVLNNQQASTALLLQHGANINQRHKDGSNLLHMCSFYNQPRSIDFLVEQGLLVDSQNDRGDTPLHLAAMKGNIEAIHGLLKHKARADIENSEKNLAIHEAVIQGQYDAYKLLTPFYRGLSRSGQVHIVHFAATLQSSQILADLLENNQALINLRDDRMKATPLHYSANSSSLECTSLLLQRGAVVDVQDKNGNTPIHFAVENKSIEQCAELCKYKANPLIENNDKLSALDFAEGEHNKELVSFFKSVPYLSGYFQK